MKEMSQQLSSDQLHLLFARLNPLDVEQFYTAYSLWSTQQRIRELQAYIDSLRQDITENSERMEQVHPSAVALATLARLQSNGVSDVIILDRMLDRGEAWLDRAIQHLEYCESLNVISDGYTKWCEHALEGAYDWIDSMQGHETADPSFLSSDFSALREYAESIEQETAGENGKSADEIIEALFLQKLMSDDTENVGNSENVDDATSMLDTTLKIRAVSKPTAGESLPVADNTQPAPSEHYTLPTEQETGLEGVEATPVLMETHIWQQETRPEEVEATPVLEETLPVQATVIEEMQEPQELQTSHEQPLDQFEVSIETLGPSRVQEYTQEPVYIYEPENVQETEYQSVNTSEPVNAPEEPEHLQRNISTIHDQHAQHDGDSSEAISEQTPIVEHSAEPSPASSLDTIYSVEQLETPNWVAAVESEQGSNVQVGHKNAPVKRKRGFWRTMLAFLFHV